MRDPYDDLADDLARSHAARRVGARARASDLRFAHFERTVHLDLPESWTPSGRGDLGAVQGWRGGVLPETKFRHFRQDRPFGSLNPGHHARWTAHELAHRLVGFAWAPGRDVLWHATMARLAETVPVALWYFLDEAGLRRCPDHPRGHARMELHCAACARAAQDGPSEDEDTALLAEGRAFVRREIDAATRSLREGRPIPSRWMTLDLCSDGLAYVAAHGPRLRSDAWARHAEAFADPDDGWHATPDALIARMEAVLEDLCGGAAAPPLGGTHARRAARDVAARLVQVAEDCDPDTADVLWALHDALANDADVARAIAGYTALFEEVELPAPEAVFAVGYDLLPGAGGGRPPQRPPPGLAATQLAEGLHSCVPATLTALGAEADGLVARFADDDDWTRRPLGVRFAAWLGATPGIPEEARACARLEADLAHLPPVDATAHTLGRAVLDAPCVRFGPGVAWHRATPGVLRAVGLRATRGLAGARVHHAPEGIVLAGVSERDAALHDALAGRGVTGSEAGLAALADAGLLTRG
jgi:hypothetical protein